MVRPTVVDPTWEVIGWWKGRMGGRDTIYHLVVRSPWNQTRTLCGAFYGKYISADNATRLGPEIMRLCFNCRQSILANQWMMVILKLRDMWWRES